MEKKFKELIKAVDKLEKLQAQLTRQIALVDSLLAPFVAFPANVQYQPSDGFVILDDEDNNEALDSCLVFIKDKGLLTRKDYNEGRI